MKADPNSRSTTPIATKEPRRMTSFRRLSTRVTSVSNLLRSESGQGQAGQGRREADKGSTQVIQSRRLKWARAAGRRFDLLTRRRPTEDAGIRSAMCALSAAAVYLVLAAVAAQPAVADEPFHVKDFSSRTTDEAEEPYTAAGGHPFQNETQFDFPTKPGDLIEVEAVEALNGTYVDPPLGFIGNPAAASRCPLSKVVSPELPGETDCPPGSRVGVAVASFPNPNTRLIYNLPPERGYPAQFGFKLAGTPTVISAFLQPRTKSYGLTIGTPNIPNVGISAFSATFFGVPGQRPVTGPHDGSGGSEAPFLSNPIDCSEAEPTWSIASDSQVHAGSLIGLGIPNLADPNWKRASVTAPAVTGCDNPLLTSQFEADTLGTKPLQPGPGSIQTDQPTGLAVDLDFPQSNDPTDPTHTTFDPTIPQAPEPKEITVKLPPGLSISPSSADGLGACSDLAADPAGDQVHYDNTKPVSCPDSSKIGSAVAISPLLALHEPNDPNDKVIGPDPIHGDVYLLKPHPGDLPIGGGNQEGKFRLLIQLENERYGVNLKLPGVAVADKQTGQLTTVFTESPQLPSSHLTVTLKGGPWASLATPTSCGKYETSSTLVPWSTPGTPDAHPTASFDVGSGPNGTACPSSTAARPFAPTMTAGTASSAAGHSSPFNLHIDRPDGDQELSSLEATLPKGLAAKFAGVPYCPEAALATAATRTGTAEQANPSCPASRIGSVTVGAGPGTNPYLAHGNAYLAGPYKGAPMSVAVITPAVAGPFDLGTVVVRNALYINPETAQGHVVSDPFPKILDGVPLRLRSIDVNLDRPDFTLNPTDCEPLSVQATIHSTEGASASPSNRFQASSCDKLGFKPQLKLSLKGKVSRRSHPSLRAHLTARPGDANIGRAQVKLPPSAFLDNAHIGDVCTRVQFAAKACPPGSIYGYATATTPLLDGPLSGNVYLRANPAHKLPDLVVGFNGPSSQPIEVELAGKTDSVKGALRNTFEAVPDVPVTDFNLTLFGGKKGLIIMSSGFCKDPNASYKLTGQNGAEYNTTPKVAAKCPKAHKANKGKKKAPKRSQLASLLAPW